MKIFKMSDLVFQNNEKIRALVSVVIPVFNRALLIEPTLKSVYNQTYRPIEVIIVDDGSTDNSLEIIKNFKLQKQATDFVVKLLFQENEGAPAARNKGYLNSNGKYIQFLDSDDLLCSNKLQAESEFLEKESKYDLVYSKARFINEDGVELKGYWGLPLTNTSLDYFTNTWQTMCPLYKRTAIEKIGLWNTELTINQDWEYCIRTIVESLKIKFIPEVHSLFRVHSFGNIGSGLNLKKVAGKELATTSIYLLLKDKGLLDTSLKKQFFKRYLFCLSYYSIFRAREKQKRLLSFLEEESFPLSRFLKIYKIQLVGKITLHLHNGFAFFKQIIK